MASKQSDTYRRLVDELAGERLSGRCGDGGYTSAAMQWGIDHEDAARRWYEGSKGHRVSNIGFVAHPDFDYVGVSPDGLVGDDGLIEIKCPQLDNFNRVVRSREMPARYRWQVQGQLWVCQRSWLDFVCYHPPSKGLIVPIVRSRIDGDRLAERCREIHLEVERRLVGRRRGTPAPTVAARPATSASLEALKERLARPSPFSEPPVAPTNTGTSTWWLWGAIILIVIVLANL